MGLYEICKSQTCKRITWFVNTAVKYGSPYMVLGPQQPDTTVRRIPTHELAKHATFLKNLGVTMPPEIRTTFQAAIDGRKKHAKHFQD
jgi:hypothetical protein